MGLFDFMKSGPKTDLVITIKAPEKFEADAIKLAAQVFITGKTPQKIVKLSAKLRADPIKKKHNQTSAFQYLGEANHPEELAVAPEKTAEAGFEIPLDFSVIDSFEIPPENLSVASAEMKAAAAANRTENYKYSIEVNCKTDSGAEQTALHPVKLVQADEVRTG